VAAENERGAEKHPRNHKLQQKAQENSIYTLKKEGMLKNISKKTYNCCKKQGDI